MTDILHFENLSAPIHNIGITSPSTRRLEALQRQVPVVGDKALVDLVNGIQVSKDIIRYRKSRGFGSPKQVRIEYRYLQKELF